MWISMLQTLATADGPRTRGEIYDLSPEIAEPWIRAQLAAPSSIPPAYIQQVLDRLDDGARQPCLFHPFLGEFGHEVMSHLRLVHFHKASEKIVCCRRGSEVLYPSATAHDTDWQSPLKDTERIATIRHTSFTWPQLQARYPDHYAVAAGHLKPEQEIFAIRPQERIPFSPRRRGLAADVVLGIRWREFCPERNWSYWQELADYIAPTGRTIAVVGARPTTRDVRQQLVHSGDLDTDAAVELLQNCKLYVGTDTGVSHLAAEVGCKMLIFREKASGSRDLTWRMELMNPGRTEVLRNAWNTPAEIIRRILEAVEELPR